MHTYMHVHTSVQSDQTYAHIYIHIYAHAYMDIPESSITRLYLFQLLIVYTYTHTGMYKDILAINTHMNTWTYLKLPTKWSLPLLFLIMQIHTHTHVHIYA